MQSFYNNQAISTIRDHLLHDRETIAVAESVTSGHIQAALSSADQALDFFHGGITVYNLGQKVRHLKVEAIQALKCNCVSLQTSSEMAIQVCDLFSSHWGIGITGYASPVPEQGIKTVFAFYAIAYKKEIISSGEIESPEQDAFSVQILYTNRVLEHFAGLLKTRPLLTAKG
jgi:nicotinamide-nucleotide amidase